MPPDLVDAAVARVRETIALAAGGDLLKDRKGTVLRLMATFSKLGVVRGQLDAFIGGNLDEVTPEQLADLKGAYVAITDGASSVGSLFPAAESDGAAALRARIAELEAKAAADPSVAAAVEQAKPEPEPTKPLTEHEKAALRATYQIGTPEPTAAEQAQIRQQEVAEAQEGTQEPAGEASATAEPQTPARSKLELQAAVKAAESVLGTPEAKALRKQHGIDGLSVATASELAEYLGVLQTALDS